MRAQAIMMLEKGYSTREIAAKVGCKSHTTIVRLKKKYEETGKVQNKLCPGRPRKLNERDERNIVRSIMTRECSNAVQIQKSLKVNDDIEVSTSTVRRALKRNGLAAWVKLRYRFLQKPNRTELIGALRPKNPLQDAHVKPTVKFGGGSIFVWGCFTSSGVGYLVRIEGGLDAELYCKILEEDLMGTLHYYDLDTNDIIFQQDNDPKHTATRTKQWFEDNEIEVLLWPPQSSDLNPIEHLWNDIDRCLRALDIEIRGKDMLWEQISNVWNETALEACSKLIKTMPERINDVIKAKGGYTRCKYYVDTILNDRKSYDLVIYKFWCARFDAHCISFSSNGLPLIIKALCKRFADLVILYWSATGDILI
ncbi:hypothetical protein RclHR1_00520002 [Rhizophagus clarus]|uniref:Tc1-like transposase DDE domain-containing protein n=1 Tax=Rhizophagus clarus TaxID=94130 RepID=A0A2Z6S388_9GLOM|nr:hypothetical protein RclHR1_00520002 [Rhizophagus clarus]